MPFRAVKEAIVRPMFPVVVCYKLTIPHKLQASGLAKESVASSLLQDSGEDGSSCEENMAKKAIASMYLGKSVFHDIPCLCSFLTFILVGRRG